MGPRSVPSGASAGPGAAAPWAGRRVLIGLGLLAALTLGAAAADLLAGRIGAGLVLAAATLAVLGFAATGLRARRAPGSESWLGSRAEALLGALLESTTEGIVLTDAEGHIEVFNPAAELIFGLLAEDAVGTHIGRLLPELPGDGTPVIGLTTDADPQLPRLLEVHAARAGGGEVPVRIWLRRLPLDGDMRVLLVVQDLAETLQHAQKLTWLEQRDGLTGLLNRGEFERRMQRQLSGAAGSGTPHVLVYIDIDQFKVVNDTLGHAVGDALVRQLAALIGAKLDQAALIGRLGGDEFGVLFVDCGEARARELCDGLMQTVRNFLFTWRDRSFDVAISIGLTAFLPENESAAAELAKADVACHMAKHLGRDRIHVYRDGDASVIRHHGDMHLVSTITTALNGGRFRLFVQPIAPLAGASGADMHYEVLVRMLDDNGDLMVPNRFIPAAEQYILMPAVDRWIIHQLFSSQGEALRAWHADGQADFLFAVNLSGTSVADESFLPYLRRQFEVHRVPPAAICFEVTETAAIRDMDAARAFMEELVAMGCSLALDDFGSGLASYSYLRALPVRYLKIDGSFVHDMTTNPVNHALVASINQVAHVLGLQSIAEWAEDDDIIAALRALQVDFAQGYAIGAPVPVASFP